MTPVQTQTKFYTQEDDPEGDILCEIRFWPLPRELGIAILKDADAFIKMRLREAGWDGKEIDLTSKGPMQ